MHHTLENKWRIANKPAMVLAVIAAVGMVLVALLPHSLDWLRIGSLACSMVAAGMLQAPHAAIWARTELQAAPLPDATSKDERLSARAELCLTVCDGVDDAVLAVIAAFGGMTQDSVVSAATEALAKQNHELRCALEGLASALQTNPSCTYWDPATKCKCRVCAHRDASEVLDRAAPIRRTATQPRAPAATPSIQG